MPVSPGTAFITASVDNAAAIYQVTVYQGRAYWITEEPRFGEKDFATVKAQTSIYSDETATYTLPVEQVWTKTGADGEQRRVYTLDGLLKETNEFFYNIEDPDSLGIEAKPSAAHAEINFLQQPKSAHYNKLTDTFVDLSMTVSVTGGTINSVVWYMISDQSIGPDQKIYVDQNAVGTDYYVSSLPNLRKYISGVGTYGFYCRVTTNDGQYADTYKTVIEVNDSENEPVAIVSVSPVYGKPGDTVTAEVMLENNYKGFADISLEIDYDSSVMQLVEARPNQVIDGVFTASQNCEIRPYVLNWIAKKDTITYNNGVLVKLVFEIKKSAPYGTYPIKVSYYRGVNGDYIDGEDVNYRADGTPAQIKYDNGLLTVASYMPGDIDGDGAINIMDVTALLRYIAGWKLDGLVKEALDVNGDGRINTKDAITILRYLAGWKVTLH